MKTTNKKTLWWSIAIKVVVFGILLFALYKQVYLNENVHAIPEQFLSIGAGKAIGYGILLVILMIMNWGFEAWKWKKVIDNITPIKFIRAFKAVWTGVTLGLFTPNRVGEFGGRILYVPRKFRIKGAIVSLIGSFSQNLITVIAGIAGLLWYVYAIEKIDLLVTGALALVAVIAVILLLLAYYNLDVMVNLFRKAKFLKRIYPYTTVLGDYSANDLSRLLLLAFLRYSVYAAQYLILLNVFGAELSVMTGLAAIAVIFLAQTVVPSFAIADLLTRLPVAALILSKCNVSLQISLAATTSIWILNLIIPAIAGYIFIIRFNIFKNRQS